MAEWWVDFHDDSYRFLYGPSLAPERTAGDVDHLLELLGLPAGARLLDLCCGDGRHAVLLQQAGLRVTGLDYTPLMLVRARERARAAPGRPEPAWVRADARAVPFRRGAFDAAVCLYNSIGLVGEETTNLLFAELHAVLKPGGQAVIECAHRDHHVRLQPPLGLSEVEEIEGIRVEKHGWFDPIEGEQQLVFRWRQDGQDREKRLHYRAYTATEVVRMLGAAGFRKCTLYGGLGGEHFDTDAEFLVAHVEA